MTDRNENECYADGKKYIAVDNDSNEGPCAGCAGRGNELCAKLYLCTSAVRRDQQNKIWIEVE